jgi:ATP-dependent DNA ligase
MLATMFTEKLFNKMQKPVFVQPKIEGDRLRAVCSNGEIQLLSSGAKERISIPHIADELDRLEFKDCELDGEVYVHGIRHSEIRSIVSRTVNLHPNYRVMEYYIFDVVNSDPQWWRTSILNGLFNKIDSDIIKIIPAVTITTIGDLQKYYEWYLKLGYEGIIIRDRNALYTRRKCTTLLKFKPRVSEVFEIVGYNEECDLDGVPKGTFGSFICRTLEGQLFNAGSGPTKYQRQLLWKHRDYFVDNKVLIKIRFQAYTKLRNVPKLLSIDKKWLERAQRHLSK